MKREGKGRGGKEEREWIREGEGAVGCGEG